VSVVVVAAAAIHSNGKIEREGSQTRSAQRLRSLESARFRYWDVALSSFAAQPLRGEGTSSFPIELGRKLGRNATARDAHSLYFETAGELGLVGLALLGLMIAAVVAATRRSLVLEPALSVGPAALLLAWAIHAGIDWDWEMPGVTLLALVCAGLMLALAEPTAEASAGGSALRS
jgi:O-antigen ligase